MINDGSAKKININDALFTNQLFKFSVNIPSNWKLFGEVKSDSGGTSSIVCWALPSIYSELEQTNIENDFTIRAYHSNIINSASELILSEYLDDPVHSVLEADATTDSNSRIIYFDNNGLEYKGKCYFIFKNGIGYIISYMATPGTYSKNLPVFEEFVKSIKFFYRKVGSNRLHLSEERPQ
ncbi:MAG: hypothetical protein NT007_10095 [Candidatus Kapabacteria bacterium]|nr:hypothetical protein [Candidatus Kapabacteria bacterium]